MSDAWTYAVSWATSRTGGQKNTYFKRLNDILDAANNGTSYSGFGSYPGLVP